MGDSITEGWVNNDPKFFTDNNFVGRGISGQTTSQMLLRFREDVINLKPKKVVILAGTNDIAENNGPISLDKVFGNIVSMVELAKANKIKVVICSVLPASEYPWRKGMEPNIKIPALNEMIKSYAASKGFVYLDYFAAMNDGNNGMKAEYTTDGVHCSSKGYELMESMVQPAIQKALKNKQK
jgi:lysophospholipase L1-like esterase